MLQNSKRKISTTEITAKQEKIYRQYHLLHAVNRNPFHTKRDFKEYMRAFEKWLNKDYSMVIDPNSGGKKGVVHDSVGIVREEYKTFLKEYIAAEKLHNKLIQIQKKVVTSFAILGVIDQILARSSEDAGGISSINLITGYFLWRVGSIAFQEYYDQKNLQDTRTMNGKVQAIQEQFNLHKEKKLNNDEYLKLIKDINHNLVEKEITVIKNLEKKEKGAYEKTISDIEKIQGMLLQHNFERVITDQSYLDKDVVIQRVKRELEIQKGYLIEGIALVKERENGQRREAWIKSFILSLIYTVIISFL